VQADFSITGYTSELNICGTAVRHALSKQRSIQLIEFRMLSSNLPNLALLRKRRAFEVISQPCVVAKTQSVWSNLPNSIV